MNYSASITDFFKSPKWLTNLLLGGVCTLIPIVGPVALMGWHIGALYGRRDDNDFVGYPMFDLSNFGKYIERGVWPFLVQMVVSLVLVPVMWIVMAVPMFSMIAITASGQTEGGPPPEPSPVLLIGTVAIMLIGYAIGLAVFILLTKPLMLRAIITQDFGAAFNLGFIKRFIALTWKEQILATLFIMCAGMVLMMLGMLAFCVGVYFAIGLLMFSAYHLDRQIYDLYLARGGEPVPLSPKLSDSPPPVPVGRALP
jgi:hypothetical protein